MNNKEIARVFLHIADILEVKEENVFRIRAYRTAANNINGLSRQLEEVYHKDPKDLDNIPGIGKDLKAKIIEMLQTGTLKYYKDLGKEFGQGFLDMLTLAGLGPKKLIKLKNELGIKNVNDLEAACKKGKLESIDGMGAKTQEKLLESIGHYRKKEGRMLLPEAYAWASEIVEYLTKSKCFKRIEKAGSLRRGTETVGDLDILTVSADSEKAMDYFTSFSEVESVIAKGPTKSSILLKEGPQVDLRVIDSASFGAALVYFTGSKQHNIKIRAKAKAKGLKVNEYGVFSVKKSGKEKLIASEHEGDVYKAIGMEWVPPELREDRGEVEAAEKGTLPKNLINLKDIKGDLHTHTSETDGSATAEEMIVAAEKKGYKYLAITDHSKHVKVANGMDEKRLMKHVEKIRKLASKFKKIKVLVGVEVDVLSAGKLDLADAALKDLDIVIAAVHSQFSLGKEEQTNRILKAMDNKYVNVLAHPSGRLITRRIALALDFDRIFEKAASDNIFLEVNTHGERIDLNDVHLLRAKEVGARFVLNTDSHDTYQLDDMAYGVITARRAWCEKKDVLNTYAFDKMIKALKR